MASKWLASAGGTCLFLGADLVPVSMGLQASQKSLSFYAEIIWKQVIEITTLFLAARQLVYNFKTQITQTQTWQWKKSGTKFGTDHYEFWSGQNMSKFNGFVLQQTLSVPVSFGLNNHELVEVVCCNHVFLLSRAPNHPLPKEEDHGNTQPAWDGRLWRDWTVTSCPKEHPDSTLYPSSR